MRISPNNGQNKKPICSMGFSGAPDFQVLNLKKNSSPSGPDLLGVDQFLSRIPIGTLHEPKAFVVNPSFWASFLPPSDTSGDAHFSGNQAV